MTSRTEKITLMLNRIKENSLFKLQKADDKKTLFYYRGCIDTVDSMLKAIQEILKDDIQQD